MIFDEAQRMTEEVIKNSPEGKVNVYFYDDSQVLIGNEAGTRENSLKLLSNVREYELPSPFREPKQYLEDYWNTYRDQLVLFGDDLDLKCIPESVWGRLSLDSRYIEEE